MPKRYNEGRPTVGSGRARPILAPERRGFLLNMSKILSRIPVTMLEDVLSPRTVERIVQDAAQERRIHPAQLDASTLESLLKKDIYRRLQVNLPATKAKERVFAVIAEVKKVAEEGGAVYQPVDLSVLEEGVKRFTLYFDWPESQRLRGLLATARQKEAVGDDVSGMISDGEDLIREMERRLQEGLVAQASEIAELRATLDRVQNVGGRDVRRLEKLIEELDKAQKQDMLLTGELERARRLSLTLRKKLESSVIRADSTPEEDAATQARLHELDQEDFRRRLQDLAVKHELALSALPQMAEELGRMQAASDNTEESLAAFEGRIATARESLRAEQLEQLMNLGRVLDTLGDSEEVKRAKLTLDTARSILAEGGLATEELRQLAPTVSVLQAGQDNAADLARNHRELAKFETDVRAVPGAATAMSEQISRARAEIEAGRTVNIDDLYHTLERQMGQVASERDTLNARADVLLHAYDDMRSLAGATVNALGRKLEDVRRVRRLGVISDILMKNYAEKIAESEGLFEEAQREHEQAQAVAASFGGDLDDLLGVFNFGEESDLFDSPEDRLLLGGTLNNDSSGDLFIGEDDEIELAPEPAAFASATPAADAGFNPFGFIAPTAPAADTSGPLPAGRWHVQNGELIKGDPELNARQIAQLLQQSERVGTERVQFETAQDSWGATLGAGGIWRLARAGSQDELGQAHGGWLQTGR